MSHMCQSSNGASRILTIGIVVLPTYLSSGVGNKADELGLEAFIEATKSSVYLHEKHRFVALDSFHLGTERESASEEWKKLVRELPIGYTFLWRPKQGKWVLGETKFPWES